MCLTQFQADVKAARDRLAAIPSQVFDSTYGEVEYWLQGEGPTILISHGITGGVDQGIGLADLYLGLGYRRLYVSRFGYLKSAMPAHASATLQAAAYKELVDYLKIPAIYMLGNSAGGPAAMQFAIHYPDQCQGLILISSAVPGAKAGAPPDVIFKSNFAYWLTTKLAGKSLLTMFIPKTILKRLTPAEINKIIHDIYGSALPVSRRCRGILFDTKISNQSVGTIPFEQIKVSSLIIHAVDDPAPPIAGARSIAAKIPQSRLVTYDGGHLLLKHEAEIQREIKQWVWAGLV